MSCKNVATTNSNYCSWPAWPWRQRHYNPSKRCELLAQQHSITILQTTVYSIQDSCWLRILRSHVWDVTVCSLTGADVWGEGVTSICTADPDYTPSHPSRLYPMLFKPYYRYCLMLALCLLWYIYVCLRSSNTVAWFYFYHHHMPLYIFFTPLNYASSSPKSSTVNKQFIYQFSSKSVTSRNLMRHLRSYKMHTIPCDKLTVYSTNDHCECGHLPGGSSSAFR